MSQNNKPLSPTELIEQNASQTSETQGKEPKKKSKNAGMWILGISATVVGIVGVIAIVGMLTLSLAPKSASIQNSVSRDDVRGLPYTLPEQVAKQALPSVVGIDVYKSVSNRGQIYIPGFGSIPGPGAEESADNLQKTGLGSGVIISQDGYILTNNHVIDAASKYQVSLSDGTQHEARFIGSDPSSDLAVLKIDAQDLTPIPRGSSADLRVGQWVMTIGSPFGLEQSVATGIVSATSRSSIIPDENGKPAFYANMIQTDAAINPGNSGGALVNEQGALIGINTMIKSESGQYSGVGFAIPSDYAYAIADDLIAGKKPSHAQLGIIGQTIQPSAAKGANSSGKTGVLVTQIIEGSAAAKAGIEPQDIITKIGDKKIESISDLMLAVRSYKPNDTVEVEYERGGSTAQVKVQLGSDI